MQVLLIGPTQPVSLLWNKQAPPVHCSVLWSTHLSQEEAAGSDCIFDFDFETHPYRLPFYKELQRPVVLGSVLYTLEQLQITTQPIARFNHWTLAAGSALVELSITPAQVSVFDKLLSTAAIPYQAVEDITGFVTTRILAAIINEAFFALGEGVSTKEEIDTALKLGTHYPKGPFEWLEALGQARVVQLLQNLSAVDKRYNPAPLLLQTLTHGTTASY